MIDLDSQRVIEMTPAELGVIVLRDLVVGGDWSQWNYINEAQQGRYRAAKRQTRSRARSVGLQGKALSPTTRATGRAGVRSSLPLKAIAPRDKACR
jgi:hypothetical protein